MAEEKRRREDRIPFPDRRTSDHCEHHEDHIGRIADALARTSVLEERTEKQDDMISELFDKYNTTQRDYTDIKEKLGRVEQKQDAVLLKVTSLCNRFERHEEKEERQDHDVQIAIDEINKFAWFRNWMNSMRDRLPGFIMWIILVTIGMLVVVSEIRLSDWFKRVFGH